MKCTKCGMEFSNANFCPNCGQAVNVNQNMPIQGNNRKVTKKDSPLSIVAIVFGFVGFIVILPGFNFTISLAPISFILALIDLGINNKQYRHLGSWVSLVFCAIYFFVAFLT